MTDNYFPSLSLKFKMTDNYEPKHVNSTSSLYSSLIENSLSDFDETSSSVLEYQQLYNRYTLCLSHLHDMIDEVSALRDENEMLRLSNAELGHRVSLLLSRDRILSGFNRLTTNATPVVNNRIERRSTERATVPKSISVRSKGYLNQSVVASQRVYIPTPGEEKEEAAVECEVYNQGNLKTELCNKWQETGACPYGENCQFAHGIKELRPVIRHPRYKTEVCRMVLAGDICPYGHRCHFRHSLTEQERLMMGSPTLPR